MPRSEVCGAPLAWAGMAVGAGESPDVLAAGWAGAALSPAGTVLSLGAVDPQATSTVSATVIAITMIIRPVRRFKHGSTLQTPYGSESRVANRLSVFSGRKPNNAF